MSIKKSIPPPPKKKSIPGDSEMLGTARKPVLSGTI